MKTEQEQIEAMAGIIAETLQDKRVENGATWVTYLPSLLGSADKEKEVAEELIKRGYGDVSEYKAEIRELKADLDHQIDATNDAENLASHLQYDYDKAFERLKAQEREITRLKDDYARVQELFAQYQMASDKEIKAQRRQSQIDVLNKAKDVIKQYEEQNNKATYQDVITNKYMYVKHSDTIVETWAKHKGWLSGLLTANSKIDELIEDVEKQ